MSPNDIEVLIHCHCQPIPHPRRGAPAVSEALQRFVRDGIIELSSEPGVFHTTSKGAAWLRMILATPYPESQWVDPRDGKIA